MTEDRRSPLAIGRPVQSVPPFKNAGGAGDNENSLYQQTLKLLAELRTIPELDKWIFPYGRDNEDRDQAFVDPVATLWACFRLGKPLCILYNALKPKAPLPLRPISIPPNATSYPNSCKKAVYDFVVACKKELGMDENNLFTISGLYKDDTNEFVKLLNTLNIIVGKMRDAGLLPEPEPLPFVDTDTRSAPRDHADKLLAEILNTERSYISDLEYLQKYKIKLQDKGQIPKSTVTTIFSNLDNLLDFQRRFLLQMEAALVIGSTIPKLGALFLQNEAHFSVYIIFCSNYQNATKQAAKYESSFDPIDPNIDPVRGLQSYLIKPIQRLCKYPLFLQELIKYTDQSSSSISELKIGLDSIRRVITLVNEEKRREENFLIKLNFIERMKDWRGINVRDFGDLLLCDTFVTTSMDVERPWEFFLFETILLCVKDTGKKKKSRKINRKDSQILHGFEPYTSAPTTYVLKGQILVGKMIYVTDTPDKNSTSYILKIFWTEGQTTNYVSLKCRNSEQSRQWKNKISSLIKRNRSKSASVETVNQRYNEPGRPIDSSTLETRRTNKHHSGSDIYMVNESDNSIDSLPNQIARSTLAEPPGMVSDFQKGNYTAMSSTIPYPIVRDANRVSISDGRNPYTAGDSYQVEEHATRDQIADSIQPVGATSRDLSRATNAPSGLYNVNQKYRTFSLSNNIDSSNGATSYHETSLSEDDPKDSTLLGAKVTRQDKHISKKVTFIFILAGVTPDSNTTARCMHV